MGAIEIISSLTIIGFAALIHASFQLSVSTLTLMSGHAIGKRTAHIKLVRLATSFITGVGVMTLLLLAATAFVFSRVFADGAPLLVWSVICGALLTLGIAVWLFYYRKQPKGTALWLPRNIASFLSERSKKTRNSGEAFGLGLTSVIAEILFLAGPIVASSLVLITLPEAWQLAGILLYTCLSMVSLFIVYILLGGGHGLGTIQKWRETNKQFLQFVGGGGLVILALYVYVDRVITTAVTAIGAQ